VRRLKKIPSVIVALMLPLASSAQNGQPPASSTTETPGKNCPARSLLFDFDVHRFGEPAGQLPVWHLREDLAFFFKAGMAIDADGAPNAYNPDNTGLDDLSNAGQPGHWEGLLQDEAGNPLMQGPDDPFPGYYISCTALADWSKDRFDPTRFVDASRIPYIALPGALARAAGARLGDLAVVFNLRNARYSFAIFADIGSLGEGSIALADNLGVWSDARQGGSRGGMLYLVFPGSGDHRPKSVEEINHLTRPLLQDWGGPEQLRSCDEEGAGGRSWFVPWDPQVALPPQTAVPESKAAVDTGALPHAHTN
jgi:hypothetical protein